LSHGVRCSSSSSSSRPATNNNTSHVSSTLAQFCQLRRRQACSAGRRRRSLAGAGSDRCVRWGAGRACNEDPACCPPLAHASDAAVHRASACSAHSQAREHSTFRVTVPSTGREFLVSTRR
jgi:hypothetical protein